MSDFMKAHQSDVRGSSNRTRLPLSLAAFVGIVALVGLGCGKSEVASDKSKAGLPKSGNPNSWKLPIVRRLMTQFDHVGAFEDGLAPVRRGVTWAYADESGKTITTFVYEEADPFSEGLAAVKLNGKWGFIDKSGTLVIEPKFELAGPFRDSLASVCVNLHGYGYIDKSGKFAIKPQYDLAYEFDDGIAVVVREKADGSSKEGLIDRTGRVILPPHYDRIYPFAEGLAPVNLNGRWGFIDRAGKLIIPVQFDHAWVFHNGLAPAAKGKWGFIDKTGTFVIAPRFDEIDHNNPEPFDRGVAKVKTYDGWGCITRTGEGVECPAQ